MASPHRQYTKELAKWSGGYLATWLPGAPVELGDVGLCSRRGFERVTTLKLLGIGFDRESDKRPDDYIYSSRGAVSVSFRGKADVTGVAAGVANASAGVTVQMQRENAVLFVVRKVRVLLIKDQEALRREILARYQEGKWPEDYFVVTEVLDAGYGTILISSARDASIDLTASGDLGGDVLQLANAELGFQVKFARNLHTQVLANKGLTPLFQGRRVRRPFFGLRGPIFKKGPPGREAEPELDIIREDDLAYED